MARLKKCSDCSKAAVSGSKYCDIHRSQHEAIEPREDGKVWRTRKGRAFRLSYLAANPYCKDHSTIWGEAVPANEVHHVVSQIDAPDRVLDPTNCVPLCKACHDSRHGRRSTKGLEYASHVRGG